MLRGLPRLASGTARLYVLLARPSVWDEAARRDLGHDFAHDLLVSQYRIAMFLPN
jgi:hypothetical protein